MSNPFALLKADENEVISGLILSARNELHATWDDMKNREVNELKEAARDLGKLVAQRVRPNLTEWEEAEIDRELAHVKARIASWSWVGASKVRVRWAEWLEQAAETVGKVLKAVGKGLLA